MNRKCFLVSLSVAYRVSVKVKKRSWCLRFLAKEFLSLLKTLEETSCDFVWHWLHAGEVFVSYLKEIEICYLVLILVGRLFVIEPPASVCPCWNLARCGLLEIFGEQYVLLYSKFLSNPAISLFVFPCWPVFLTWQAQFLQRVRCCAVWITVFWTEFA